MNYKIVSKLTGLLILFLAICMIFSLLWSVWYSEWNVAFSFLYTILICIILGGGLVWYGAGTEEEVLRKEGMAVVGIGWLLSGIIGSLPFILSHTFRFQTIEGVQIENGLFSQIINSLFETLSGFTTTGSTVLTNIEIVPKGLLFWRSFTHWLGGMGIIVLFIAILPMLGAGAKRLFKSEVPGPIPEGLRPRIKTTALILWGIYMAISAVQTIAYLLAGMDFFDALCHTFGTMATGGFSPYNASIGHYQSAWIEYITVVFMVVAGINFGLYFQVIRGDYKTIFKDSEMRVFFGIVALGTFLIMFDTMRHQIFDNLIDSFRYVWFQVVSIITTTGYGTSDFNTWPPFSKLALITLMFFGASSGSTGGGMKIIRLMILVKLAYYQIYKTFHPQSVVTLKIGGKPIGQDVIDGVTGLFIIGMSIFVASTLAMGMLGLDIVTATTSVAATLWNIGPGLEKVGSIENFAHIPNAGKILLTFCMLLGRLEFYTILALLLPTFWRN
ncbi:MAG: hypothetical protein B6244_10440 [Candidatus Cloacimonetes bacterium 4572_55]|nr:MAG: hypothetical protein B6244_10440 [Candidatus Cloacimonetes bacterium 4572_55]